MNVKPRYADIWIIDQLETHSVDGYFEVREYARMFNWRYESKMIYNDCYFIQIRVRIETNICLN